MSTSWLLVAVVALATLAGGFMPLHFRHHHRLFLAFSAGSLVGLSLGELIPEGLAAFATPRTALALVLGAFVATMALDKLHILHPHAHAMEASCPPEEHRHPPLAMHGVVGLLLHSALDGIALAAAVREGPTTALAVALALSAHKLGDGLTTVSLVLAHHHTEGQAKRLLFGNALLLLSGFALGLLVPVPQGMTTSLLLFLAGFFLYLGASDLIPALTTPRCRKRDVVAVALGIALVAGVGYWAH
ncbi:MAG: ZIP family metal transporter [Thermoanaerobaculum sp.]|nr:ZIP family metal transporter [Thermoanaerobaculum sp.]